MVKHIEFILIDTRPQSRKTKAFSSIKQLVEYLRLQGILDDYQVELNITLKDAKTKQIPSAEEKHESWIQQTEETR